MTNKMLKTIVAGFLVVIFLLSPMPVFATMYHWYERFSISVEGMPFEVYGMDGVRLQDAAFMLNGTSAQFDIAEPPCGWDFWIRRGEAYTPDGTELQRPTSRNVKRVGDVGFSDGFHPRPYVYMWGSWRRNIIIGLDGDNYPAITISIWVSKLGEYTYFSLRDLAYWLGFELTGIMWEDWRGADYFIATGTRNAPTPSRFIRHDTFPIGTMQTIAYAYTLRVRTGPGNGYDVLTFVHRGYEFEILDYSGRFVQIYTSRGAGWVFAGFLSRGLKDGF